MFQCTADTANGTLRDVVEAHSVALGQTITQPNFQSTLAFVREFRRSEEVVPSLWVVLVIQAVSELPVAQYHGRLRLRASI